MAHSVGSDLSNLGTTSYVGKFVCSAGNKKRSDAVYIRPPDVFVKLEVESRFEPAL